MCTHLLKRNIFTQYKHIPNLDEHTIYRHYQKLYIHNMFRHFQKQYLHIKCQLFSKLDLYAKRTFKNKLYGNALQVHFTHFYFQTHTIAGPTISLCHEYESMVK